MIDKELAAVLICLAPLGPRGLRYVNTQRREFDYRAMLKDQPWSSGERQLIIAAGALWNRAEGLELAYIAGMSREFFSAFADALAARRGENIHTDWLDAYDAVEAVSA